MAASSAPGYSADLDENRALRDETRQVIAGLQTRLCRGHRHQVAEDPAQQRARLLHRGHGAACRRLQAPAQAGHLHPPPDGGERHALRHHRTGRTRTAHRRGRRPRAGHRAGDLRRAFGPRGRPARRLAVIAGGRCRRQLDVAAALGGAGRTTPLCAAAGRCLHGLRRSAAGATRWSRRRCATRAESLRRQ